MKNSLVLVSVLLTLFFGIFLSAAEPDLIETLDQIEQERTQREVAIRSKYVADCEAMYTKLLETLSETRKSEVDAGNLEGVLAIQKAIDGVKQNQTFLDVEAALVPLDFTDIPSISNDQKTTQEAIEKELQTQTEEMFRAQLEALDQLVRSSTQQERIAEAAAIRNIWNAVKNEFDHYSKTPKRPVGWKKSVKLFPQEKNVEIFDEARTERRHEQLQALQTQSAGPSAHFSGCRSWTEAGAMSADGAYFLTGSNTDDCTSRLYEFSTQQLLGEIVCEGSVTDTAFHPTLPLLVAADTTPKIRLWNSLTYEKHAEFSPMPHYNVMRIAIHKDGEYGIAGSDKGRLFAWNLETGKVLKEFEEGHTDEIRDIVFHQSGKFFATTSVDSNVHFWSMGDTKPIRSITPAARGDLFCLRFSSDGTKLAVTSKWNEPYVLIYDAQSGELVNNFGGYGRPIRSVNFSSDGRFLVTGDVEWRVVIWEIETKQPLWSDARNAGNHIYRVQFTPDQKTLIVVSGYAPTIYNLPERFAIEE